MTQVQKSVYAAVVDEMAKVYNGITNRKTLELALHEALTEDDCKVWLLFPTHTEDPATYKSVFAKSNGINNFENIFKKLLSQGYLANTVGSDGITRYVQNNLFEIMMCHNPGVEDTLLAAVLTDWFNTLRDGAAFRVPLENPEYRIIPGEAALTGNSEFGDIPMNLEIPDTREVVTYDFISEFIKKAEIIVVHGCFCRKSKDWLGTRECDHPTEVCILFDDIARTTLESGDGRVITADEALEIVRNCRAEGLVTQVSNTKEPGILCNCCSCCCLPLQGAKTQNFYVGKPSRYIIQSSDKNCVNCGACAEICPVSALKMTDGKRIVEVSRCIGCGLCVSKCSNACLSLKLREDADKFLPDREKLGVFLM